MNKQNEQLRTALMEAILEYIEGYRTFRSVLTLGVNAHNLRPPNNPTLAAVIYQLNSIANNISNGKAYSRENIKEIFTTMLEILTKD